MNELKSQTLAELAFKRIRDAIIQGELEPGTRLDEVMLARNFGISRGPLREALRRLEERKLLDRKSRVGVSVANLSLADVVETFLVREALEGMAARLAAANITEEELGGLKAEVERQAKRLRGGAIYESDAGDFEFHLAIARSSGNARLHELLANDLLYLLCLYRGRTARSANRARVAMDQHREIIQALQNRDGSEAEHRMREHIRDARHTFVSVAENGRHEGVKLDPDLVTDKEVEKL